MFTNKSSLNVYDVEKIIFQYRYMSPPNTFMSKPLVYNIQHLSICTFTGTFYFLIFPLIDLIVRRNIFNSLNTIQITGSTSNVFYWWKGSQKIEMYRNERITYSSRYLCDKRKFVSQFIPPSHNRSSAAHRISK